jgi:hypothetical protein
MALPYGKPIMSLQCNNFALKTIIPVERYSSHYDDL